MPPRLQPDLALHHPVVARAVVFLFEDKESETCTRTLWLPLRSGACLCWQVSAVCPFQELMCDLPQSVPEFLFGRIR